MLTSSFWFRLGRGYRLVACLSLLLLILGGLPARAQSPVADPQLAQPQATQPDIKLIHLYEHTCAAGVDPRLGTLTAASQACPQSIPNVNFTLSSQAPGFQAQSHPTNSSSDTEWHEIPSGFVWSIQQAVPTGYRNPVVRCQMNQSFDQTLPYQELTFAAPGGRLDVGTSDLSLTSYVDVSCYWFDIPYTPNVSDAAAAPQADAAVQEDPSTPTPTPRPTQPGPAAPQADAVVQENPPTPTPTPSPARPTQPGPAAPQTEAVVQENPPTPTPTPSPPGVAAPQAQEAAQADALESTPTPTPAAQETLIEQSAPEPGENAATPGVVAAVTGGARLDIRVWSCPFHAATSGATVDQLNAICAQPSRNANFTINGDPATQRATDSIGATSYQSVPYGAVTIRYLDQNGTYDPVRVFCYTLGATASHGPLDASKESAFSVQSNGDVTVTLQVNPGEAIDCIWFNQLVTAANVGSVLVQTYTCPTGTNTSTGGLNELMAECQPPHPGVTFLMANGFLSAGATTDSAGRLTFLNYSPGPYSLRQAAPLGYVPARVFCRAYNADDWDHVVDPYVEFPVVNTNGVAIQLQAHWELDCIWFDIEGTNNGYLDITAYACPANFTPPTANPRNTFAQRCTVPVDGASYQVDTQTGFDKTGTSVNGVAFGQEPVPPTMLAIHETSPPVYQLFASFCGTAPYIGIGAIPSTWIANGTSTTFGVASGVKIQVVCEFYYKAITIAQGEGASPQAIASPADEADSDSASGSPIAETDQPPATSAETGGTLHATLASCPGTNVHASQCVIAPGPATLHFDPVDGNGTAFDLQIGNDGTGQATVIGTYQLTGFPFDACLIDSDAFDANGLLTVQNGDTVEIAVYLCGGS